MNQNDQAAREQALNPTASFIVQAPAGSGKTELLTQRFLKLLSTGVKSPEEIIAITFTRKAAGEMRHRILSALEFAVTQPKPKEEYRQLTYNLATAVLERDAQSDWKLRDNPNRLRILTIDSLCATLAKQLPLAAGFSSNIGISDNAQTLYMAAAKATILSVDDQTPWQDSLKNLLAHQDNRASQLAQLFAALLSKREQWLGHILSGRAQVEQLRDIMEEGLQTVITETLSAAVDAFPSDCAHEFVALAHSAAENLIKEKPSHPICACLHLEKMPGSAISDHKLWMAIAELLLTQKDQWRKSLDKRSGFIAKSPEKVKMQELLIQLKTHDDLLDRLIAIRTLPPSEYTDSQWNILNALLDVLPILAAQLQLIFQQQQQVDFTELNLAALRALGDTDNPTDLALYLDHQIQHLLIDEFQDTSMGQFTLLELLTAGWQSGDGRTVFLVGDPMQSIYRFRNAEVGLFLRAKSQGIGDIDLQFLQLTRNFRSQGAIVHWINNTFPDIFPHTPDIGTGAVPYASAQATHDNDEDYGVASHPCTDSNAEADLIVSLIQYYRSLNSECSIAILVRSRAQLIDILPALHHAKLDFQAVDIEPLHERMEIQDLLSLTQALWHRADRLAWLAILRAPWCGLTLNDLHIIAQHSLEQPICATLNNQDVLTQLSKEGQQRLARIAPILGQALANIGRYSWRDVIYGTWQALGGPACLPNAAQLRNCDNYFELLSSLENSGEALSLERISQKIHSLFASPNPNGDSNLQIMTIHKSKGLEFDHIILPDLTRRAVQDKGQLLLWLDRPNLHGSSDLLLAPIKATIDSNDPIYAYLRHVEKLKLHYEMARLLYVAITRAKLSLDCLAIVAPDDKDSSKLKTPPANSFMNLLWPTFGDNLNEIYFSQAQVKRDFDTAIEAPALLYRLPSTWTLPSTVQFPHPVNLEYNTSNEPVNIMGQRSAAQIIGTLIHEILETISLEGIEHWNSNTIDRRSDAWLQQLSLSGISDADNLTALNTVKTAIINILNDPKGRWILQPHSEAHSEYPLSYYLDDKPHNIIIDRTFIAEGVRWIVDYKTATPGELSPADFLQQQTDQYQQQLDNYAQILYKLDSSHPIKTALYFPLCQLWHEVETKIPLL